MIDAAIRYAQQFPIVPVPLSTGTPEIFVDPYLGNATVFGNSTVSTSDEGAASAATTVHGTDLVASLQVLNDALAAYQGLNEASSSATGTGTGTAITTSATDAGVDVDADVDANTAALAGTDALTMATTTTSKSADALMKRKIQMLGDVVLTSIQAIQKRAEMAEQENKKMKKTMKKVLRERAAMAGMTFANKTTRKTVMDKMGKGVLERYVNMVAGGN